MQNQLLRSSAPLQQRHFLGNVRQRRPDDLTEPPAFAGQEDGPVPALEKFDTQFLFQLGNLFADRGLGHAEFIRRARKTFMARGGLKRSET